MLPAQLRGLARCAHGAIQQPLFSWSQISHTFFSQGGLDCRVSRTRVCSTRKSSSVCGGIGRSNIVFLCESFVLLLLAGFCDFGLWIGLVETFVDGSGSGCWDRGCVWLQKRVLVGEQGYRKQATLPLTNFDALISSHGMQ